MRVHDCTCMHAVMMDRHALKSKIRNILNNFFYKHHRHVYGISNVCPTTKCVPMFMSSLHSLAISDAPACRDEAVY